MTLDLGQLPRTIVLTRVGEALNEDLSNAAADTVAAFVSEAALAEGTPVLCCLDQRALPDELSFLVTDEHLSVISWVKELAVRGAPAIGAAGACALALAAFALARSGDEKGFLRALQSAADAIRDARPTAVNLSWAVDRALAAAQRRLDAGEAPAKAADALFDEARIIMAEDEAANRAIGHHGSALLPDACAVLTHCNAGSLATSFYGTALGVVYAAAEQGKIRMVFADETRPVCQGSRLTAWELGCAGVPVTLICDDMAASVMSKGLIDAVIVGADRIAANGDVANKIGTLGVAVLARHFGIPFYVAAPISTIDANVPDGSGIPIEQRAADEVLAHPIEGVSVLNPAFDVTPADLICAIITERGVFEPHRITESLGQDA